MELNAIQSVSSGTSERSRQTLSNDFDSFLTLLTTQLSHQDPLDPVDSNEFVAQLVSFTGVEQAINTNSNLEELINLLSANRIAGAVGLLGTTVEIAGNTASLGDDGAEYQYSLPENSAITGILIKSSAGQIVFSGSGEITAGAHSFVWDGRDNNGVQQPPGNYTISVTAKDANDELLEVSTSVTGRVTGIDTADGGIVLTVNGVPVPFENIISVKESDPPAA